MAFTLIMYRDDGSHRPFAVAKDETIVGRREDCDLRIAVSDVSRKHSKLTLDGDRLSIEDLGSSNGTFVNGKKINASPLKAGDVVAIGPVTFVVQADGSPSDESLAGLVAAAKPEASKAPAAAKKKPAPADDDIDELLILNDSADGSGLDIDLSDDAKR